MRVAGYVLHYGKEYLGYSVRRILPVVDRVVIYYTARPSFGHSRGLPCPDSREELLATLPSDPKIEWHDVGPYPNEGQHRDALLIRARSLGAKQMIVVDADEIWSPVSAECALRHVWDANSGGRWLARFQNFFRSWRYEVRDSFRPVRIIDFRHPIEGNLYLDEVSQPEPVFHFGYAQSNAIMDYKWSCHGHQSELRDGWMTRYLAWTPEAPTFDLHPCVNNLWDRAYEVEESVYQRACSLLPGHPYADLSRIT